MKKKKPKLTVVFVPSIGLIKQIRADWLGNTSLDKIRTISICSSNDRSSREDEVDISQKDLDFKITTNPKELKNFINKKTKDLKIIFCTYQSSKVIRKAVGRRKIFDFAIFDEAHRTAKVSKHKRFNKKDLFSYALYDENIFIKKRLFMTATRRVEDRKNFNNAGDAKLTVSMDKEEIYGRVCYPLTFFEAAKKKIIAKSKFIVSHVTSNEISSEERNLSRTLVKGINIKTEQVADQIAIKKAVNKYNIKKLFTFHTTVNQAYSFTKDGPEGISSHLPNFFTATVNGGMRSRLRDAKMQEFRENEHSLMSNARCLIEGIDVPEVSMVAFVTPKQSEVDIVQATGRALRNRNQKNKKFGYVLIPIFVERKKGEKESDAIKRTDYEKLANVIKAMSEHDDEIKQIISELLTAKNRGKGYGKKAIKKLKKRIEIIHPTISQKVLLKHITSITISKLITRWDEMIGMLMAYKDKFGNCDVPYDYFQNQELAKWVHVVRRRRLLSTLYNFQIAQLDKLDFNWKLELENKEKHIEYINFREIYKKYNVNDDRAVKKFAEATKLKVITGYKYFKTKKSSKGIYTNSLFLIKSEFEKQIKLNKILDDSSKKEILKLEDYLDVDDFIKYCHLDSKRFYPLRNKVNLEEDFNYLGRGVEYKKKINIYGKIFHKNKKKEFEKLLGYKFIKYNKDILSRNQAISYGISPNAFSKRSNYKVKKRRIKEIGFCIFPGKSQSENTRLGKNKNKNTSYFYKAYYKADVLKYLKDQKITLTKKEIINKGLINNNEMIKQLYHLTGYKTFYFKALTDNLLIPAGKFFKASNNSLVVNYFQADEIEKYKKRILKKYKIKKNETYIFNYTRLKELKLLTENETIKVLNCSAKIIRNLRANKKFISLNRYNTSQGTPVPRYAYAVDDIREFVDKNGKYSDVYKNLILCDGNMKTIFFGADNRRNKLEDLFKNKKIKKSGFTYYKSRFVFLVKYNELKNYIIKNVNKFKNRDTEKVLENLKKLIK